MQYSPKYFNYIQIDMESIYNYTYTSTNIKTLMIDTKWNLKISLYMLPIMMP